MKASAMPSWWEGLIQGYLKKTFYPETRRADFALRGGFTEGDYRFFAKGVRRLNELFTKERTSLPANYFHQKDLRSGYLLYFLPVNALKVAALLEQNARGLVESRGGALTIVDLGSGPGTGMFGTFLFLSRWMAGRPEGGLRLRWILIDQNREVLKDAERLHNEMLSEIRLLHPNWQIESQPRTMVLDLARRGSVGEVNRLTGPADLVLVANLLGELPPGSQRTLLETLLRRGVRPGGRVLVVEPALQRETRRLMELHDEIVDRGIGFLAAPCLHQAACPMLRANRRDWCHTYLEWNRPPWIERIDRLVGIRKDYLKCSYLVLGEGPPPAVGPDQWRVVSGHLNSKGKTELLLCGPASLPNLRRVRRLDRDRTQTPSFFDEARRGDLIKINDLQK